MNVGKYEGVQSMGLLSVAYVSWREYFCMQLVTVYDPSLLSAEMHVRVIPPSQCL